MSLISLPNQSVTGPNLWSQVEDNDQAIVDVVNGAIDDDNIAASADIDGSKLLAASVDTTQLANDAVDTAQIADDAVDTAQIADDAVDTAQIASGAVTAEKIAASTTATPTYSNSANPYSPGVSLRKYPDGLVVISGNVFRAGASKYTTYLTLPEGYRPSGSLSFPVYLGTNVGAGLATISTGGAISFYWPGNPSPGPEYFYLSGITFHAA